MSNSKINKYELLCLDCKLGIKTYQNLVGSFNAFERLSSAFNTHDHTTLSSLFTHAVIKYAKLFVETSTLSGKKTYPIRTLKAEENFSTEMHKHLLSVRNTLVAHDDFDSIEPKILQGCMGIHGSSLAIPLTIGLSNKCLSYPDSKVTVEKMRLHVAACVNGALKKLEADIAAMRKIGLVHPEQAESGAKYNRNYGPMSLDPSGESLNPPNFMADEWLNPGHPDFTSVHNGFVYEELRVRADFNGPETIPLPEGGYIEINPSKNRNNFEPN